MDSTRGKCTRIFASVGTQLPFDRLIGFLDEWCGSRDDLSGFAQIATGGVPPRHLEWCEFLSPEEYTRRVLDCDLVVAHAGMGSIITALEHAVPILIAPRRADLGEHRNDHQLATALRLEALGKVRVAYEMNDIPALAEELLDGVGLAGEVEGADPRLLAAIRDFIGGKRARILT